MVAADRYYALCAASALLTYACVQHGANLSDNSVIIKYETMRGEVQGSPRPKLMPGHMFIDPESARNLELVQNNITMKNTNTLFCERCEPTIVLGLTPSDSERVHHANGYSPPSFLNTSA